MGLRRLELAVDDAGDAGLLGHRHRADRVGGPGHDRAGREEAARVAAGARAQLVEIEPAAPSQEAAARLRQRAGTTDASEATPEVLAHMAAEAQAWPSAARLDAAQSPAAVLKMAEAVLSHAR